MDTTICEKGIESCIELIDAFINTKIFCNRVYKESLKYRYAVYDMFYLNYCTKIQRTIIRV